MVTSHATTRSHVSSASTNSLLKLSFVLSIPAAIGGGVLAAVDSGLQGLTPTAAIAAFITAAIVGYLSIDLLLRIIERVAFWAVCIGLGTAAIVGGVLVI